MFAGGKALRAKQRLGHGQVVTRLPAVGLTGGQWAEWSFPFTAGNLTAVGYSPAGAVTARHTVETTSAATAVVISVDVP